MILTLSMVNTGKTLDTVEVNGPDVSYATRRAASIVESKAASQGIRPAEAAARLEGWTNGYLLFARNDDSAKSRSVKHLPGQHNQQDHAGLDIGISGLDVFDADDYETEFGDVTDDVSVDLGNGSALSVRVFDSGDAHLAIDLPDGSRQVVGDVFHDDGMRDLADDIDRLLAVDFEDLDEDDAGDDGLVDRNEGYQTEVATGLFADGDLMVAPKGGEDHVVLDRDQAEALVLALGEMAETWELNFGGNERKASSGTKHLPGQHDQRSHGRRGGRAAVGVGGGVANGDFSGLTRVGGRRGFNEGGLYEDADGQQWYVKEQPSLDRARSEVLAGSLYRAAGLKTPQTYVGSGAPGLADGPQTASRWVDTSYPDTRPTQRGEEFFKAIQAGFAVDAWLANWDAVGAGERHNIESLNGEPIRIESGGALRYRGTGGVKGAAFGDTVGEWDTMRSKAFNPSASEVFGEMTDVEAADSTDLLKPLTPQKIRKLVADGGMDAELADRLIARRADLLERAKVARQEERSGVSAGGFALITPDQAQEMQDRLLASDPWTDDEREALREYTGDAHLGINSALRDPSSADSVILESGQTASQTIKSVRSAMRPLPRPVRVYRSVNLAGLGLDSDEDLPDLGGRVFQNPGFSSASVDRDSVLVDSNHYDAILVIDVPEGTQAAYVESVTQNDGEFELLLDAGMTFEYTRIGGTSNGFPLVYARVVPQ